MNSKRPAATIAGASAELELPTKRSRSFTTALVLMMAAIAMITVGWYGHRQVGQTSGKTLADQLNASLKAGHVAV